MRAKTESIGGLMKLSIKQQNFTYAIGRLIIFAHDKGYKLTPGDAYRDPRLHGKMGEKKGYSAKNSVHKVRLAMDFNLFINGEYITDGLHPAWDILHTAWISYGGADAIPKDANHFSFEYNGFR